jgi:tetratricopeptide (TPR) repeat protein
MNLDQRKPILLSTAILFSILLVGSKLVAGFWNSPLLWGFSFGAFLPAVYMIAYVLLSLGFIFLARFGSMEKLISRCAGFMDTHPRAFIGILILIFVSLASLFRIQAPLLGDSTVLINNYENAFKAGHPLYIVREPLAIIFFYYTMGTFGVYVYPSLMLAFFAGELLLGSGFIIVLFFMLKEVKLQPKERFLLSIFLLLLPSTELFFGYAEVYSVVLFALSVFTLAAMRCINGKSSFFITALAYFLLLATHVAAIIILPALIYLGWLEYKKGNWKSVLAGFVFCLAGVLILRFGTPEIFLQIFPENDHPHYLPLFQAGNEYDAYTLFSLFHLSEIGNLMMLVCPFALFFFGAAFFGGKKAFFNSPQNIFFILAAAGIGAFIVVAKFDLAVSVDWDVSTPWLFLVQMFAAIMFLQSEFQQKAKVFLLILLVSLAHSLLWFCLNATVEPNIQRVASLRDSRVFSPEAYLLSTVHLARYEYLRGNLNGAIVFWEEFTQKFPDNPKGFLHLVSAYSQSSQDDPEKIERAIKRWIEVDPGNKTAKDSYISFCKRQADEAIQEKHLERAGLYYTKVIEVDSANVMAYNNLGNLNTQIGRYDRAIPLYMKTIVIDTNYVYGYSNLGKAYIKTGDYPSAIRYLNLALSKDSTAMDVYTNLATIYRYSGNIEKANRINEIAMDMEKRIRGNR